MNRRSVSLGLLFLLPASASFAETQQNVSARVRQIVVNHLGVEANKVIDSAKFIDDLGADSLDCVELVMAFEEEFGCEIPDAAAEKILTVADAIRFLENCPSTPRPRKRR